MEYKLTALCASIRTIRQHLTLVKRRCNTLKSIDKNSTPLTSTIHSHVQWEINETRMRASFPALVRVRLVLASIAFAGDVGSFLSYAGRNDWQEPLCDQDRQDRHNSDMTYISYPKIHGNHRLL